MLGLGAAAPSQRKGTNDAGKPGEDLVVPGVILEVWVRHAELGGVRPCDESLGVDRVELDDVGNVPDGQGMEKNGVDDGKDGGVGTDAQRQRKNRDGTESGILGQHANGVTNVLPKSLHCCQLISPEWPELRANCREDPLPFAIP